jgi:hypothetical protein
MALPTPLVRFLLLTVALSGFVSAQRIPRRPPGFTLGGGSADAGVQLESYIDLVRYASYSWIKLLHNL